MFVYFPHKKPFLTASCPKGLFMGKFILSNDFHSLKIPDQNIRAVLDSQLGGIQDHVVVIHITPHFTGIFIIIVGALRIIFLKHFFCLIMRKTFLLHDTFNTIFLIRAHIHVKYIRLILQDLGCTTSQNDAGMFRQPLNNLRFRSLNVTIQILLYVRLIIHRHPQLLRQLLCDQTGSCSKSSADSNYKVHRKHLLCKVLSFYDKGADFAREDVTYNLNVHLNFIYFLMPLPIQTI